MAASNEGFSSWEPRASRPPPDERSPEAPLQPSGGTQLSPGGFIGGGESGSTQGEGEVGPDLLEAHVKPDTALAKPINQLNPILFC